MGATKSAMASVLVKLQAITMNANARVCGRFSDRICFSLKLWQSLFFVKLQSFTMNGNGRFCDSLFFSKASDLSYKHKSFTKSVSDEVYARVCF